MKSHSKTKKAAMHFSYICVVLLAVLLFVFTSCSKDYSKLVKERVEQYRKEGKWILSYTDEEHFIVYADKKTQTIGIDTLSGTRTINLGKLTDVNATLTFGDTKIVDFMEGRNMPLSLQGHGFVVALGYSDTRQSKKLSGYKDKYMVMDLGDGIVSVLFFDNKKVYKFGGVFSSVNGRNYTGTDYKIKENGDLDVCVKFDLEHSGDGLPDYLPCTYVVTLGSDGNIKEKADHVICCGVEVPVGAFDDYINGNLTPYVEEMRRNISSGKYL